MKYHILSLLLSAMLTVTLHAQQVPPPPPLADSAREANIVFTRVEVEAMFPGGQEGWRQFLVKNLRPEKIVDLVKFPRGKKEFKQTVIVRFIVNRDGSITDIRAENIDADPYCIREALRVFSLSPNWIPAYQNGRRVNAYRRQPITFVFER